MNNEIVQAPARRLESPLLLAYAGLYPQDVYGIRLQACSWPLAPAPTRNLPRTPDPTATATLCKKHFASSAFTLAHHIHAIFDYRLSDNSLESSNKCLDPDVCTSYTLSSAGRWARTVFPLHINGPLDEHSLFYLPRTWLPLLPSARP